jgi:hypothetical protein
MATMGFFLQRQVTSHRDDARWGSRFLWAGAVAVLGLSVWKGIALPLGPLGYLVVPLLLAILGFLVAERGRR